MSKNLYSVGACQCSQSDMAVGRYVEMLIFKLELFDCDVNLSLMGLTEFQWTQQNSSLSHQTGASREPAPCRREPADLQLYSSVSPHPWMTVCQCYVVHNVDRLLIDAMYASTLNSPHHHTPHTQTGLINFARNACEQSYHRHPDVPYILCQCSPTSILHTRTSA